MQVKLQVPLEFLFPDEQATFERLSELLKTLSRTDTLLWIGSINLLFSNPSNDKQLEKQRYIARLFLPIECLKRLDQFATQNDLDKISLLERPALLELARWVSLLCQDEPNTLMSFNFFCC